MRLVLVVEAPADAISTKILADRVLIECGPDWVNSESIDSLREWTGIQANMPYADWHYVKKQAQSSGVRVHGSVRGPDYAAARLVLNLAVIAARDTPIHALVLVRDMDNQPDRRIGLEAVRNDMETGLGFPVVIGTADPEREAWVLNGFVARSDAERDRLDRMTSRLGFDPSRQPNRLRGDKRKTDQRSVRDIKEVLAELADSDPAREQACLQSTPLKILVERGEATGLANFLYEVNTQLSPLFDPAPVKPCCALGK